MQFSCYNGCYYSINYRFLQKNGVNRIKTVKSSSLPISIRKVHHHFAKSGNTSKLFTGPKAPNAGPIFPSDVADPPIAVRKSSPRAANTKAPRIKNSI